MDDHRVAHMRGHQCVEIEIFERVIASVRYIWTCSSTNLLFSHSPVSIPILSFSRLFSGSGEIVAVLHIVEAGGKCSFHAPTSTSMVYILPYSVYLLWISQNVMCTGIYISKTSYIRSGERSLDTFYKPYHSVVYYRYLRFFPDGRCWSHVM